MYRKLLTLAAAALLALAVAVPTSAATSSASATGGFAHNCPSITSGIGGYSAPPYSSVAFVNFGMVLSSASCKQATYTLDFYALDASGNVSATPIVSQSWTGDGVTTQFVTYQEFANNPPFALCVVGTVVQSKKITHQAPDSGGCYQLISGAPSGSPFRG